MTLIAIETGLTTAGIAALGVITAASISALANTWQARKTRHELKTRNGHTAGESLSRLEESLAKLEGREERDFRALARVEEQQQRMDDLLDSVARTQNENMRLINWVHEQRRRIEEEET